MAETMTLQQIHETTIRQQTAINNIQATLKTQQQDIVDIKTAIVDIRTSINHIIHSVSEIATKLGFQITLPPPLPLSPIPLSPLSTLPLQSLNLTTTIASQTISPKPSTNAPTSTTQPINYQPFVPNPNPSHPVTQDGSAHQILKSFSDSHIEFIFGISDTLDTISWKQQLNVTLNFFDTSKLVGAQIPMQYGASVGQTYRKEEIPPNVKMLIENKKFIFDPGGIFNLKCIFDLEDKVVFKGSVMIRLGLGRLQEVCTL